MAFLKFKLQPNRPKSPVLISAAVSRPSLNTNQVQSESQGTPSQTLPNDARYAHLTDHTTHVGHANTPGSHDLLAPITDQRYRCSKRVGSQPASTSPVRSSQASRPQKMTRPSIPSDRTEPQINSRAGTDPSDRFLQGFDQASPDLHQSSGDLCHRLNCKVDAVFSSETAQEVFHRYIDEFAPKCPVVVFPPGTTAQYARKTKPLLFLSILSVASAGYCTMDQQRQLALELRGLLVESAIKNGEKSLELVQALQVASLWYRAPDNYIKMNQTQLASVALTMAIDLGLDRLEGSKAPDGVDHTWNRTEAQRAWLGCFLLSASLSLILRRPNPTNWNSKLDEYLHDLQQSKASPTDSFLCELVTTEHHCQDVSEELFLGDPGKSVSLRDPKTTMVIKDFQSQVDWPPLGQFNSLEKSLVEFNRFASSLYIHELALHVNHNLDEFKAPFSGKSLESCNFVHTEAPSPSHVSMLRAVTLAAQGLLDTFICLSISDMLALPPHIYGGRLIYAVIILTKLDKAIRSSVSRWNGLITVDQLRLNPYIEQLVLISKRLITTDERNSLSRSFLIMPLVKEWLHSHISRTASTSDEGTSHGVPGTENYLGSLVPAAQTQTGSLGGSSAEMQMPSHAIPDFPGSPGRRISQYGYPLVQGGGAEIDFEPFGGGFPSDIWFEEFLHVNMLH